MRLEWIEMAKFVDTIAIGVENADNASESASIADVHVTIIIKCESLRTVQMA